ncbi:MAG TPA: polyprenyl synthetase family protein [Armatimonadetes bacterium]|nr:polyprenyl synthetase family protein [Armatimonadota bacterium]
MTLPEILRDIQSDLQRVERKLRGVGMSPVSLISAVYLHTLEAGGKRLRPALVILAGRATGRVNERTYEVAAAIELIHLASLIHDDVVDDADLRRGRPTSNRIWGNRVSILVADYLFSQAYTFLTHSLGTPLMYDLSQTVGQMVAGELSQLENEGSLDLTQEQYLEMIKNKTGALMAIACKLGARVSGGAPEQAEALSHYGLALGTAFQMADDLLDLTAEEGQIGKPVGNDIRNGRLTLPLIYTLHRLEGPAREEFIHLLSKEELTSEDFLTVRRLAQECGGVDYAQGKAREFTEQAKAFLHSLPPTKARDTLSRLADYILTRRR